MKKNSLRLIIPLLLSVGGFLMAQNTGPNNPGNNTAAMDVLARTVGREKLKNFSFILESQKNNTGSDTFSIRKEKEKILIRADSPVALCYGAYYYLKKACNCTVSWSGSKINIPAVLPDMEQRVTSPYRQRYYFNVVTHGYSTAYWDWPRWEKEIDWMALHGINMPLIGGAHEAILFRVFQKLGLTKDEIKNYFSGPAFFPWNRMGNLSGWNGPVPDSYFQKQIRLTHKMLKRMRALGMNPIVHAFAGFVPKAVKRLYPAEEIRELGWGGGLPHQYNAFILSPNSRLFLRIGKSYIREWEKEFGKGAYYLADSFNEMDVPLPEEPQKALKELAGFGERVYRSIKEANPEAVWVMQGWTFPFHRDKKGNRFWTPERLRALMTAVPDDKLLILDLANEYNRVFWKIEPCWKTYDGFFGKRWIYSFIPNMGGKVPLNGPLEVYASISTEALTDEKKGNLVGFGFAPEGIENNEMVYELLSDMAWARKPIHLKHWIKEYCLQRYGAFPVELEKAFALLTKSCYGSFSDHPMFRYQLRPTRRPRGVVGRATVHRSPEFARGVEAFLSASENLKHSELYTYDALDLAAQYLGLVADKKLVKFVKGPGRKPLEMLREPLDILVTVDKLLESHPNRRLEPWLRFARKWGDTKAEKDYYESDARRLLTTWGGDPVNDYAGRTWSGLIRDYYVPRWREYHKALRSPARLELRRWEEEWIKRSGVSPVTPFKEPVKAAWEWVNKYKQEF